MTPSVSVIILNLNGLSDTIACIRALLKDGYQDKEIILWDNGSRGDDAAQIERAFPNQVRVFRTPVNIGFAGGNNRAIEKANGEFVILLNNDTEVEPGWIPPLLSELTSDPSIVACQPKLRSLITRETFDYAGGSGGFLDCFGFSFTRGRIVSHLETDHGQYDDPVDIDWVSGACMAVRRADFQASGGFDEFFFAYSEEIDLCLRWHRQGRRIRSVPSSTVFHRSGSTWRARPHTFSYYKHRNSMLTLMKNVSLLQLLWVLPVRLVLEIAAAFYYAIRSGPFHALAPLRSLVTCIFLLPWALTKRGTDPAYRLPRGSVMLEFFVFGKKTFTEVRASVHR